MNNLLSNMQIHPCWKYEGVWGDKTCGQLVKYTHCRNCRVFGEAAAELLERPVPEGYREEWTERIAEPRYRPTSKAQSIVIFRIGEEWLGLATALFIEVVERRPVHSLPHREGGILEGVINIRGELLVCISLARLFKIEGKSGQTAANAKRLLVIAHPGGRIVFPAEEVYAGCRYYPEGLSPIPATLALAAAPFTTGIVEWEGRTVGVLNDTVLFDAIAFQLA